MLFAVAFRALQTDTKAPGPAFSAAPSTHVWAVLFVWLPVSSWIGWRRLEHGGVKGSRMLAVIRGLPASLVFLLSQSFLQMGARVEECPEVALGLLARVQQRLRMGAPAARPSPSAQEVLNLDLTPEMEEIPIQSRGGWSVSWKLPQFGGETEITCSRECFERSIAVKSPRRHS